MWLRTIWITLYDLGQKIEKHTKTIQGWEHIWKGWTFKELDIIAPVYNEGRPNSWANDTNLQKNDDK